MSPQRVVMLLVAGLAVIAFAIWLSSTRHLERSTLTGDLVLPGLEQAINSVSQVDLSKGDGTRATLKKVDGGAWTVAERGWPADTARVRKLLLDLGALTVVEEKTRLPANYPQLGVEDISSDKPSEQVSDKPTGTRVAAVSPARTWALIVGKPSSGKSGYVRVVNAPQTLLAAPLLTVDAAPGGWLDRGFIDISAERVREIEEHPAAKPTYMVTRVKQGEPAFTVSPIPKGRTLTGPAVAEPMAASLAALSLDDVRKADPVGAAGTSPAAAGTSQAVFRTYDGLELTVTGHQDGQKYALAVSAHGSTPDGDAQAQKLNSRLGGFEFEIPEYRYAGIFKPVEELLTVTAKPAASKGAAAAAAPKTPALPKAPASPSAPPAPAPAPVNR
jgi:hypothetical protein